MKFEGQQVNIPIKGIMRAGTDNLCADGAMNEVIGMEYKDGSWLPYEVKKRAARVDLTGKDVIDSYIHKLSDDDTNQLFLIRESGSNNLYLAENGELQETPIAKNVKDVSFIGNMLCVSTDSGLEHWLWSEGSYEQRPAFDRGLHTSLRVTLGLYDKDVSEYPIGELIGVRHTAHFKTTEATGEEESKISIEAKKEHVISGLTVARGEVRDRGGLTGYVLACVGYRGSNGEIISVDAPVLLNMPCASLEGKPTNLVNGGEFPDIIGDARNYPIGQLPTESERPLQYDENHLTEEGFANLYKDLGACWTKVDSEVPVDRGYPRKLFLYKEDEIDYPTEMGGQTIADVTGMRPLSPVSSCTMNESSRFGEDSYTRRYTFTSYQISNKLQYKIPRFSEDIKEQINSVCIFLSPEVHPYKSMANIDSLNDFADLSGTKEIFKQLSGFAGVITATSFYPRLKEKEAILKEIRDLNSFYLVDEIYLDENPTVDEWVTVDLKGKLGDNLLVREQLSLSAFNMVDTFPQHTEAYNYRLHVYNYMQKLFSGFNYPEFSHNAGNYQYEDSISLASTFKWEISVEIEDSDGNRRVVNYSPDDLNEINFTLTPFLSYPSLDAKKMTVYVYDTYQSGDVEERRMWYKKEFKLTPIRSLGLSCYIEPNLKPINMGVYVQQEDFPASIPVEKEINNYEYYHNGLKVSDVAYPLYFPIAYTYRLGNEKIIGLARLTMPMSQDNFGNYSLIVFCTDGIYSLRVDTSGNGAYTSQAYVSPEICTNRNSICEIGGAVLFAGDKGLMILTGENSVQMFAPHLNGKPRFLPDDEPSKEARGIYRKLIDDVVTLEDEAISKRDFVDFIQDEDTHLIYISSKNKLLAYNKNYDFSYFIDIPTRNTTKLAHSAVCDNGDIINRTLLSGYTDDDEQYYDEIRFPYESDENPMTQCLIQSRPIKVQQDYKCSYRVVLTGYFLGINDNWADLVVFGSLDGDNWRVIGVKEKKLTGGFHDLGCVTERGSWKYLMFIFGGQLSEQSHIDSVDITVDGKYNNKKR